MSVSKLNKYIRALGTPAYWPVLKRGTMPGIEHTLAIQMVTPSTILDVGANKGQFASVAARIHPNAEIWAFEPLRPARLKLERNLIGRNATILPFALGREANDTQFYVADREDSSSLYRPASGQQEAFGVGLRGTTQVQVRRLDEVIDLSLRPGCALLKIDVQGGELDVLDGAKGQLPYIGSVYLEGSFVELYQSQPLITECFSFLVEAGFQLRGVFNCVKTQRFGPTQADFLFTRRS